jgi:hypothetical protein
VLQKLIGFTDFDDNPQAEIHYFHYSKVELIEMEVQYETGFGEYLKKVAATRNSALLLATIKEFVLGAYGIRSEDGKKFAKSPEARKEFEQSPAFEALFMELASDGDAIAEFLIGVMPKDLLDGVDVKAEMAKAAKTELVELPEERAIPAIVKVKKPHEMSREELLAAFQEKSRGPVEVNM